MIRKIANDYGTPFYLLDMNRFISNFRELEIAFKNVYSNFHIAYSFKTNYTPAICKQVRLLGGYAEVVSAMEYQMAKKYGFQVEDIIVNGPGKIGGLRDMIEDGALLMLDNSEELDKVLFLSEKLEKQANVGFRMNFEIGSGKNSRFGFDANSEDVLFQIKKARNCSRINIKGLHFHLGGARTLEAWKNRAEKMVELSENILQPNERAVIDLGSGMFGHLAPVLAEQFNIKIPSFKEYAEVVAGVFREKYGNSEKCPALIVEPGTTIVANTMDYITKVVAIKNIRNRSIAIVDGSVHQLGEMGKKKKMPLVIVHPNMNGEGKKTINNAEITGYTCLEEDILYRDCEYPIGVGDLVVIGNAGAYSNVLKPPFIQPGCKIVMSDAENEISLCKREETIDDILSSYVV